MKEFAGGIGPTNIDLLFSGLENIPELGTEIYSDNYNMCLGGGVPGTLTNLAGLGVESKVVTSLSDDTFSKFALSEYKSFGANIIDIHKKGIPFNISCVMVTDHERTIMSYTDKDKTLTKEDLEKSYNALKGAKVVLMQKDDNYLPVYEKLKKDGSIMLFDTGWDETMSLESYSEYLEIADYYFPNRKEAMKITGENTPQKAAQVLSRYFKNVIVKLDRDGCLGMSGGETFIVPEVSYFNSIDSTGAGDAFLAGFMYGLMKDMDFKTCIKLGNLTGGKCTEGVGCLTSKFDETTLLKALKEL